MDPCEEAVDISRLSERHGGFGCFCRYRVCVCVCVHIVSLHSTLLKESAMITSLALIAD